MSSSFKLGESIDDALSTGMFFRDEIYLVKIFLAHTSIILNHRKKSRNSKQLIVKDYMITK